MERGIGNMKIKNIGNSELIKRYTEACFLITNYPDNKSYSKEWEKLYLELCNRLGISQDEIEGMIL